MSDEETTTGTPTARTQERVIRVFISSTFRDMHDERNYLVKFIFPELRKMCESRGVTWGEVDLRWGVTTEQAAEGKVLPICLEEIKRCRPYFIGLLGERYGWVPETIPQQVIEREPWLKAHVNDKKSVTELEILHGVLLNPDMAKHAYFYFRDPAYVTSLPKEEKTNFTTPLTGSGQGEDKESGEKLKQLKDRIRASGFPVREKYPDPKALGELVKQDLIKVIDQLYPQDEKLDSLDREEMDHEAYAQSRAKVYIGRQVYFDRLDAHANGGGYQPLVILGESGSGKSALLANWVAHYRQAHPDALILQHFIGASPYSADWMAMLRRIMGEFKRKLGIQQDLPDNPDALRSAFPNWLHMATAKSRVVLVLDALNQLEDRDGAPDLVWLPPVMPENVRLIVSTLSGRALDETTKRSWPTYQVEPLKPDERKDLIKEYLAQHAKSLDPVLVERIAFAPQSANPLYLRILLDELRLFGVFERLEERIGYYLEAGSPYELYEKVIARWENDYEGESDLVGDTLSLIWAARRGLSESELLGALGSKDQPLPRAEWSPLFLAMGDGLISRRGLLTFAHEFLRTGTRDIYLTTTVHQQQAHTHLADYFERQPPSPRRTDELLWQLMQAALWPRLYIALTSLNQIRDLWELNPNDAGSLWARLESQSNYRMEAAYANPGGAQEQVDTYTLVYVTRLLRDAGHVSQALSVVDRLLDQSVHGREPDPAMAQLFMERAYCCQRQGNLAMALSNLRAAEQILRCTILETNMQSEESCFRDALHKCLGMQATILREQSNPQKARELLLEVEAHFLEQGDLHGQQASSGNLAAVLGDLGQYTEALTLFEKQEAICRRISDQHSLAVCLDNQAAMLQGQEQLRPALLRHRQAETLLRELGDVFAVHISLYNQALLLRRMKQPDKALSALAREETLLRRLDHAEALTTCLYEQASILAANGDKILAQEKFAECVDLCRKAKNMMRLQECLHDQANILLSDGRWPAALSHLAEAEEICRENGFIEDLKRNLGFLALINWRFRADGEATRRALTETSRLCKLTSDADGEKACQMFLDEITNST